MSQQTQPKGPYFHLGGTVPPEYFVDRQNELRQARKAVVEQTGNVLIVGKRKIGKTSFVERLRYEIEQDKVLSLTVNLVPFDQNPSGFLREILLLLCYEIGNRVFNKTTSQMLATLGTPAKSLQSDFRHFHQIYKLTRSLSIARTTKSNLDVRLQAPAIVSGGVGSNKEEQIDIGVLHPFEFMDLAEELATISHNAGHASIVVVADEANRLAAGTSKEILRSYFDVFSSKRIQFVFVADLSLIDYKPVQDLFDTTLTLGPFPEDKYVHELLARYFQIQMQIDYQSIFSVNAVRKTWELSKGHPFLVQLLCSSTLEDMQMTGSSRIEVNDVLRIWVNLLQDDRRLVDLWE